MKFLLGGLIVAVGGLVVYGAISGYLAQMIGSMAGIGQATSGTSSKKVKGIAAQTAANPKYGLSGGITAIRNIIKDL